MAEVNPDSLEVRTSALEEWVAAIEREVEALREALRERSCGGHRATGPDAS